MDVTERAIQLATELKLSEIDATKIESAIREAISDRDIEWWQATALVDNVAPEPQAVRHWIATSEEYHVKQAVAAERERCARIADTRPLACDEEWSLKQVAQLIREGKA